MNNTKKIIGSRINSALALRDMKQKELAKILGVTDNTVSYYVSGARTPNAEQIIAIANALDVSADYILGITEIVSEKTTIREINEYTGLSEHAIESLACMQEIGHYQHVLDTISLLIENATAPPYEGYYANLNGSFNSEEYESDLIYWKMRHYVPVILKICDYLSVIPNKNGILKIFSNGEVKVVPKDDNRFYVGSIANLDLSNITENSLLEEIKRCLIEFKKKVLQNANDHKEE